MIPYWSFHIPALGPIQIHVFGILVACGILVGSKLTRDRGAELGLKDEMVTSMITTILVCGFLFSHIFDVAAYQTAGDSPTIWQWLNPFGGLSSYGGFMGALGGLFFWIKVDVQWSPFSVSWRKPKQDVMPYADCLGYGLAAGWTFGRLGCFSAHDHPGHLTDFWLAVKYPGGARHDLGLDEAIWAFCIAMIFLALKKTGNRPLGLYVSILTTAYAPVRFAFDFLRADDVSGADPRYAGLTPAQWSSAVTLVVGVALCVWTARHAHHGGKQVLATSR